MKLVNNLRYLMQTCGYVGMFAASTLISATPFDDAFNQIGAQQWMAAPNSKLEAVAPNPIPDGTAGVDGIMSKWSGGAYDTTRDQLVIWGGGHKGYAGNEVYTFNVNNMQWTLFKQPTPPSQVRADSATYLDGNPSSRHTYDGLVYIPPPVDRLYAHGDALWGRAWSDDSVWLFDFNNKSWTRGAQKPDYVPNDLHDYDFVTSKVYSHGRNYLKTYDAQTNSWNTVSNFSSYQQLDGNGAVDPIRRKFVRLGGGLLHVWDIDNPNTSRSVLNTTGATEIINSYAPGFVYDPVSDKYVAWNGTDTSGSIYVLDMDTLVWTRLAPTGPVKPGTNPNNEFNGVFGRFQYIPSKNAFIAVKYTDDNVFIYKLNNQAPMSAPNKPAAPNIVVQ